MGLFQSLGDFSKGLKQFQQDIGTGILKGVGSTARGTAQTGERGLEAVTRPLTGVGRQEQTGAEKLIPEEAVRPEGIGQQIGFAGEQIGEFLVPGAGATKAAKVAQKAVKGGGGLFRSAGGLASRAGIEFGAATGQTALQTGEVGPEALTVGTFAGAMPIGGAAIRTGGKIGGTVIKFLSSKLSGVPVAAMEQAIKNPAKVRAAMQQAIKNPDEGANLIRQKAVNALEDIKSARNQAYREALEKIEGDTATTALGLEGAEAATKRGLTSIRGLKIGDDGIIDAAQTTLRKHEGDLQNLYDTVRTWDDTSPLGLNELRKVVDAERIAGDTAAARNFNRLITQVSKNISDDLGKNVPELAAMNKKFAQESTAIDDIMAELSIGGKRDSTIERKLLNVFNPKSEVYREYVAELGEKAGVDLMSDIAGLTMARMTPEGLGAYLTSAGVGGGVATILAGNVGAVVPVAATLAVSSPRVIGEVLTRGAKAFTPETAIMIRESFSQANIPAAKFIGNVIDSIKSGKKKGSNGVDSNGVDEVQVQEIRDFMINSLAEPGEPGAQAQPQIPSPAPVAPQTQTTPTDEGVDQAKVDELLLQLRGAQP